MKDQTRRAGHDFLYAVGDEFPSKNGTMIIVDRERAKRQDGIYRKYYDLKCPKGHQQRVEESHLKARGMKTCSKCTHPSIAESDPDFAKWFADPLIPQRLSKNSHEKADFICQNCGRMVEQLSIKNVYRRQHIACPVCSDGFSYPERYVFVLLSKLKINFKRQYCVYVEGEGKKTRYFYDFYDIDRGLIIETHGQQHFEEGVFERVGGYSLERIQEIDRKKFDYATLNLGLGYLFLDCRYSEPEWIKNEAIRKLSRYYSLEMVDWQAVQEEANSALIFKIIELSKQGKTNKQIGMIVQLNEQTVCMKLQKAKHDGIFDGVTPRTIQAEENRRIREKKRIASEKEKNRIKEIVNKINEVWVGDSFSEETSSKEAVVEKMWEKGIMIAALDPARNTRDVVRFMCGVCKQVFSRSAVLFFDDDQCPFCEKAIQIRKEIQEKFGGSYEMLGRYKDCFTPIQFRHNVCGSEFELTRQDLLKRGCPECGRKARMVHSAQTRNKNSRERFLEQLPGIEEKGYLFVDDEFRGISRPHKFLCRHCGDFWNAVPQAIIAGRNHICISPTKRKSDEEFKREVYSLVGDEYTVLSEYIDSSHAVQMRHNKCGRVYSVLPAHFTSTGRRCPCEKMPSDATAQHNP